MHPKRKKKTKNNPFNRVKSRLSKRLFLLIVAEEVRRVRGIGFSTHARIILPAVAKFRYGRRRNLITIIRATTTNEVFDYAMRRYDLGSRVRYILETEEIRFLWQIFHFYVILF